MESLVFTIYLLLIRCVHQGFALANNESGSIYTALERSPGRAGRFANAMRVFASQSRYSPSHLVESYDWGSLGTQIHVVDVGGGVGHVAIALARHFENVNITVQDMKQIIAGAEAHVPEELLGRVRFQDHDLLKPQVAEMADVVLLRWVLHNWSDHYATGILRQQVPILKPGSRLIIQDVIMPGPGAVSAWREMEMR